MKSCTLIFPEMLTVGPQVSADLNLPSICQFLRFSEKTETSLRCYEQSVLEHLGFEVPSPDCIPGTMILWQEQLDTQMSEDCVCADPIYIRADNDNARIMDAGNLHITDAETDKLLLTINDFLEDDGLTLIKGSCHNWFLTGMDSSALATLPVKTVVGRNMTNFLPDSVQAGEWLKLMTELQMLLFTHPVNQHRESRGQFPINGVWFWGQGKLKSIETLKSDTTLYASDAFARGTAKFNGVKVEDLGVIGSLNVQSSSSIVVDNRGLNAIIYDEYFAWREWMEEIDQRIFSPLLAMLKTRELESVVVDLCNGQRLNLRASDFLKFWRRNKSIEKYTANVFANLV